MSLANIQFPPSTRMQTQGAIGEKPGAGGPGGTRRLAWQQRSESNGVAGAAGATTRKEHFDRLYRTSRDPWNCEGSHFQRSKRGTMLAALPRTHYGEALEIGCSNGVSTVELAERCDHLLGIDVSETALEYARRRTYPRGNVRFLAADVPAEWPQGRYDLIVISDVLYYLSRTEIRQIARLAARSLTPSGECVLVNWRGDTGMPLSGEEAAEIFVDTLTANGGFIPLVHERHDGYLLQVYGARVTLT